MFVPCGHTSLQHVVGRYITLDVNTRLFCNSCPIHDQKSVAAEDIYVRSYEEDPDDTWKPHVNAV